MRARLLLPAVACLVVPMNSTMITVALPALREDFGVTTGKATVIVTAYLVTMLAAFPIAGRIGERWPAHRVLRSALLAFLLASVAAAAAPSLGVLTVARCAQAIAAAFGMTSGMALVRRTGSPDRLGADLGLLTAAIPIGALLGPILAGAILEFGSWRLLPLANLAFLPAFAAVLPRAPAPPASGRIRGFRWAGVRSPGAFGKACVAMAALNMAMYSLIVVLPIALLEREDWRPIAVGACLAAVPLLAASAAIVSGRLVDRHSARLVVAAGASLVAFGCALTATGGGSLHALTLIPGGAAIGLGLGVAGAGLQAVSVKAVPEEEVAGAAGVFSGVRYAGSVAGTVAVATWIGDDPTAGGVLATLVLAGVAALAALALGVRLPGQALPELGTARVPAVIGRD